MGDAEPPPLVVEVWLTHGGQQVRGALHINVKNLTTVAIVESDRTAADQEVFDRLGGR
jgi:hypothetical protein